MLLLIRAMEDPIDAESIYNRARNAGLSITSMCQRAGIAKSTFFRWKRGTNAVNVDTYKRLRSVVADAERENAEVTPSENPTGAAEGSAWTKA